MAEFDLERLYERYAPMVHRRCVRLVGAQAAPDALQETFLRVMRRQEYLHADAPAALLNRVATNVCLNQLRVRGREEPAGDQSDPLLAQIAASHDLEERTGAGRLLDRLLGREPGSTATIAVLHLHDGLTLEEVAQEVGLSVSGVRKRLRKLRASLHALQVTP